MVSEGREHLIMTENNSKQRLQEEKMLTKDKNRMELMRNKSKIIKLNTKFEDQIAKIQKQLDRKTDL